MKNSLILLLLFTGLAFRCAAQVPEEPELLRTERVFKYVELMPTLNGGIYVWLKQQLTHLRAADKTRLTGRVEITFIVNENGSLCDFEITSHSGNPLLDNEAMRVVRKMPAWNPGRQNGVAVRVYYTLPIVFLDDKTEKDIRQHIYESAEQMPRPTFNATAEDWVAQQILFLHGADKAYPQGQTTVRFIVNDDGTLTDFTVLKSSGNKILDAEAIKLAREMPIWNPGRRNGLAVKVYYNSL